MEIYDNEVPLLIIPSIEPDDVEQEAAIFEWETGKRPNKQIIQKRLENQRGSTILYFGDYAPDDAKDPWENTKVPPEVIEYIVEFALSQSEYVAGLIFHFLDTYEEGLLIEIEEALNFLGERGRGQQPKREKRVSIADIIRKSLPLSIDEMIALVAQVSPQTKRPAATARQAIRDAKKRGTLVIDDKGYIHDL